MGIKQTVEITTMIGRVKKLTALGLDDETIISMLGITKEEFEEIKKYSAE
ncbi:hypothetical protein [Clostridium gasigenes]|uniref:Uncharacterized protein n=1 Tax=Clostridium gasigenes TaxID=94869 RepID=A0A1H0RLG0_9CLOT|nr:hypothetical protein [Clostridium gasigenes]MBB6715252.1 hypothetical protein [Clostridium gasigenes]MBU3135487.1 hypothetical protein [Clostridium gasigenes]NKF05872.1 hypothetical protein [Clostridium gasigenes]QSW19398.1 hypothetical protein J1C67_18000 [Clostridium gasigenes]SDP29788.1 hypothetical protein SAMN04488529_103229 [Clostridium gasigenes]